MDPAPKPSPFGGPSDDRVLLIVHDGAAHTRREVGECLTLFQSETDLVPIEGNGWSHFQCPPNSLVIFMGDDCSENSLSLFGKFIMNESHIT